MYIQDWLTLKVVKLPYGMQKNLKPGDKVVYSYQKKKFIGTYIGYECDFFDYVGNFLYKLDGLHLKKFYEFDKKAKNIFFDIKDDLKFIFPMLKFITAKMNFLGDVVYLYFFGENRIDFRNWLSDLKDLIGQRFFLYQVGARDKIRLDPASKSIIGDCGNSLCCIRNLCKIVSVETKTINLQNLQNQGIDKQKGVCGKLKCCLKFEENIYLDEFDNYPSLGSIIEISGKKYTVIGINILSGYLFVKDDSGYIHKINKDYLND